jgi:drug/metabolite transporter (DMT)-like permease
MIVDRTINCLTADRRCWHRWHFINRIPCRQATKSLTSILLALTAILIWSTLALFSSQLTHVSPFLVLGVALMLSGSYSLVRRSAWRIPITTLAVGVGGIFGYHFLYFRAMALAPAVEASLINYLWPLLIVVLSPLVLPGYHLRPRHVLGALLGLAGAGLIASGASTTASGAGLLNLRFEYLAGYLMMAGAALIWALYSLLTKRVPPFSTESVAAFCAISGLLALAFYFLSGGSLAQVQTLTSHDWLVIVLCGLGPMGAAFFFWDAALKRGDPRRIGSLAYLTPLLSTLNLVIFAKLPLTPVSFAAMALIISGAVVGSSVKTEKSQSS